MSSKILEQYELPPLEFDPFKKLADKNPYLDFTSTKEFFKPSKYVEYILSCNFAELEIVGDHTEYNSPISNSFHYYFRYYMHIPVWFRPNGILQVGNTSIQLDDIFVKVNQQLIITYGKRYYSGDEFLSALKANNDVFNFDFTKW